MRPSTIVVSRALAVHHEADQLSGRHSRNVDAPGVASKRTVVFVRKRWGHGQVNSNV
jgi:hypothetical protein